MDKPFPPVPRIMDFPVSIGIALDILFVTFLIIIINRFDATHGVLAISLLVVLAFIGLAVFSVFFTIPTDEITSAVIGGLVAAFGMIIAHWVGKNKGE